MPNKPLPADGEPGDSEVTTGDFQTDINQIADWLNDLQAELNALSGTTVREGAVRTVNGGAGPLRSNIGISDTVQFGRITDASSPGNGDFDSDQLGYWAARQELSGDFDPGQYVKITRIGNMVHIFSYGSPTHTTDSFVSTGSLFLPTWARPADTTDGNAENCIGEINGNLAITQARSDGGLAMLYRQQDGTAGSSGFTGAPMNVTFVVDADS